MKSLIPALLLFGLPQSCGNDSGKAPTSTTNSNGKYLSTRSFTFAAKTDPTTLTYNGLLTTSIIDSESYVISSKSELDTVNQNASSTGPAKFLPISIDDLSAYSYFCIKSPACPGYSEFSRSDLDGGVLPSS
jgi:hypothetical protein